MNDRAEEQTSRHQRRGRRRREAAPTPVRSVDYHNLENPFVPQRVFSDDAVAAIHNNALRVLEELGIKVLLPAALHAFRASGATVDIESQTVKIGREIVEQALATAPKSFSLRGGSRRHDLAVAQGRLIFAPGGGCPNTFDRERGRRPGSLRDYQELMTLTAGFDALQVMGGTVEPQDIPTNLRHYAVTRAKLLTSDKIPVVHARGTGQTDDCFELIRLARGISHDAFRAAPHTFTVINTNSPRQLDSAMAQGIIDFAKAGQVSIITPFCLAGAMAPITVAGALSLQHAEALAGIALAQITAAGAPVMYGSFCSSVDMRSGSPAFGTPEHIKATLGSGQLARHIGLPWRASAGTSANCGDAQAAHETELSVWSAVLAGATMVIHSAGWLEGGLTLGYEKMITDMEMVQTIAELCQQTEADEADLAFEALADVAPGGHFFATEHTMQRYRTAFYEPIIADRSNYGQWQDLGRRTADDRATEIWQARLRDIQHPPRDPAMIAQLDDFIERRTREGGAPPMGT